MGCANSNVDVTTSPKGMVKAKKNAIIETEKPSKFISLFKLYFYIEKIEAKLRHPAPEFTASAWWQEKV